MAQNKKHKNSNLTILKVLFSNFITIILLVSLILSISLYYQKYSKKENNFFGTIQVMTSIENKGNSIIEYKITEQPKKLKGKTI
jgi:hypothetical protein